MKKNLKQITLAMVLMMSVLLVGCSGNAKEGSSDGSFKPSKNVEWVVTSSAGGGSDIYTRIITDIMGSEDLVSETFLVNNQTDGGGEVGRLRVSREKSDGHMLLTFNSGDLTPMVQNTDNRIENFKPVAIMAIDQQLMLKSTKTTYADFAEAIEAAKSGTQIVIGGSKGDDIATYEQMLKSLGLDDTQMAYMMFDATSDALTALLGGHVDFAISKPAASMQYLESGDMEPVVTLATKHFEGDLADVPLLSEIGDYEDVDNPIWRGVVAPGSTPDAAIEFWSDVLKQVSESERWKTEYIEKNLLVPNFMSHDEAKEFMHNYQEQVLAAIE